MGYAEKKKVRCSSCGTPTNKPVLNKVRGIIKWVCSLCDNRIAAAARNGT